MNNTSMFTADRMTHLKIVVVSLVCATVVAGIGVTARMTDSGNGRLEARAPDIGDENDVHACGHRVVEEHVYVGVDPPVGEDDRRVSVS